LEVQELGRSHSSYAADFSILTEEQKFRRESAEAMPTQSHKHLQNLVCGVSGAFIT
jgi:hypothetical protein